MLQLEVDGRQVEVVDRGASLLEVLREDLGLRSPKDGCSPQGQCGCCTVLVDGKAVVACNLPLRRVEGKAVTTLEGLPAERREEWANAFAACGGLQCGFCIPGIVMRAKAQIDKKGTACTREAMAPHLGAHLCRCTGYVKILEAVEGAAAMLRGEEWQPARETLYGSEP